MKKNNTTTRNQEIEVFRFLFICAIAIMHFSNSYFHSAPYFSGSYIGTEFFFLVSGFMIMKAASSKKSAPFIFTLNRMKKLYPHYLTAFFLLFLTSSLAGNTGLLSSLKNLFSYCFEFLFLHASGLKCSGLLNYPTWYLSSLIIAGFFIYACAYYNEKLYLTIIAPLSVLVTYSFFSANTGHIDVWGGNQLFQLSDALTRGFAAMSLGALSYALSNYLKERKLQFSKQLRILFTLLELLLFLSVLAGSALFADTQYDFYFILMLFAAITLAFSGITYSSRLFSFPLFAYLGKISYPMYVYQLFIICLFCLFLPNLPYLIGILSFLTVTIVFSALMDKIINKLLSVSSSR